MICQITASTFTTQYQYDGTTAKLRVYYSQTYIGSSQEQVRASPVGSDGWFDEVDCTVSGGLLSHPAFNLVATVDGTPPTSRVYVVLYSEDGVRRETIYGDARGWFVPAVSSVTPQAWRISNRAVAIFEPLREYLTAPDAVALILSLLSSTTPALHATSHQNGGADEINVGGLSGLLGDPQTPLSHKASHQLGGGDELNVGGLTGLLATAQNPAVHASTHENGGSDEVSVTGLSGLLADGQTPLTHATSHQNNGADEISVAGLSGLLADSQTPLAHKTSHQSGGSDAIKLDDLAAPDDNTDLDASIAAHGLLPKLSNNATEFLNGVGAFAVPAGAGYSTVEDEGSGLTQRTTINFVGAGVTAADSGGKTVVTIPGGGGGTDIVTVWAFS